MARSNDRHYQIGGFLDHRSFWLATTPGSLQATMPYVCTEAGTLYGERGFYTGRDFKDSYLLLYTFGGTGCVTQNNRTVTVRHGRALLMDCRSPQAYGTSPQSDHWYHLWAHVEGTGVDDAAKRLGLPALVPVALSRSRVQPHFDEIFARLQVEDIENGELVGLAVHTILSEMLIAQARNDVPDDNPVALAQSYVISHYGEQITVDDIARAVAVSQSYLTRLFRQQMGTSPHDYLLRYRITKAKQLLMETDLPIGAIAQRVGFPTASNFSYQFSKITGTTPRAYRGLRERATDTADSA